MNILLVSTNQFGYLVDYYEYVKFFDKKHYQVTYVAWDYNKGRIDPVGAHVIYVSRSGNKIKRFFRFLQIIIEQSRSVKYDKIIIKYFPCVSFIRLFIKKENIILDIRTVSAHPHKFNRFFRDIILRTESLFFPRISVISDSVAKYLKISDYTLMPLGGSTFTLGLSEKSKRFQLPQFTEKDIVFFYVGTLENRNMVECVKGFHLYLQKTGDLRVKFLLVGDAPGNELSTIRKYIEMNSLQRQIYTFGYIPQIELGAFFDVSDYGVSYVPITSYYNVQPPTKTLEYLINGLPVLATATLENKNFIKASSIQSGVLIRDDAEAVCEGLIKMNELNLVKHSNAVKEYYQAYQWENILSQYLPAVIR